MTYVFRFKMILLVVATYCIINVSLATDSYVCNYYHCAGSNLLKNQCIYAHPLNGTTGPEDYEISLQCEKGYHCLPVWGNANTTCQPINPPAKSLDKEPCKNNTNCYSNKCDNDQCVGKTNMEVCTDNNECAIGFYCKKITSVTAVSNCVPQEAAGKTCDSDYACQNNMGCYTGNHTCIPYFSLPDGSKVDDSNPFLCQNMKTFNNYCISTKLSQDTDECKANSDGSLQTECSYSTTGLPSNVTDQTYKSKCQCSKAYYNKNFCKYDTQQSNWQKLINALKDYYNDDALKKHTVNRNQYDFDLKRLFLTVYNYPEYKDADDCAIDIDISSTFSKISTLILALIFIILA